jgi:cell division protein FtsW (lipid II flippase)
MGKQFTMNTTNSIAKPKTMKHFFTDNFDLLLGVAVLTLLGIGFLMVYSASWQYLVESGLSQYYTVWLELLLQSFSPFSITTAFAVGSF